MTALVTVLNIVSYLLYLYSWVIIIQFVLQILIAFNVVNTYNDFVAQLHRALNALTEPVYRPIRRILPDTGGFDFSPAVVLILITIMIAPWGVIPAIQQSLTAPPVM